MYILSKSEIQSLQGQKQVSKSYRCKAKTLFFLKHEDTTLFPDIDLTNRIIHSMSKCDPWNKLKGYKTWLPRNRHNGDDLYEQ